MRSCWYVNETRLRGIGSKFETPGEVPWIVEEGKKGAKVWVNGWIGELLGVYAG